MCHKYVILQEKLSEMLESQVLIYRMSSNPIFVNKCSSPEFLEHLTAKAEGGAGKPEETNAPPNIPMP